MKRYFSSLFACSFLLFSITGLSAQEALGTIEPDRPGYGDAVSIVPARHWQFETGFGYERDKTDSLTTEGVGINSTLFRFGLSERVELRFDYNVWYSHTTSKVPGLASQSATGLFPCRLGLKASLAHHKDWVPDVAFIGMLGMPWSATKDFRPDYPAPDLQLSFASPVNDWFTICYNLGSSWDGNSPSPQNYLALSRQFAPSDKTGVYVQGHDSWQTSRTAGGASTHQLLYTEAGFQYFPKKNIQIDLSGGLQIGEYAPKRVPSDAHGYFFAATGLSWRFPE